MAKWPYFSYLSSWLSIKIQPAFFCGVSRSMEVELVADQRSSAQGRNVHALRMRIASGSRVKMPLKKQVEN